MRWKLEKFVVRKIRKKPEEYDILQVKGGGLERWGM